MGIQLQETDTAAIDGSIAACSGKSPPGGAINLQATQGGAVGSATHTFTAGPGDNAQNWVQWESASGEPAPSTWNAGNYILRLNITGANSNITWDGGYVCRVNSSGVSQATVGSLTGQSISLGTTGVKSMTISGSQQSASAGDRLYFVLTFTNADGVAGHAISYKADQSIDTPITLPAPPTPKIVQADIILPPRDYFPPPGNTYSKYGVVPVSTTAHSQLVGIQPPIFPEQQLVPPDFPWNGFTISPRTIVIFIPNPVNNPSTVPQFDYQVYPWPFPYEGSAYSKSGAIPYIPVASTVPPGIPKTPIDSPIPLAQLAPGFAYSNQGITVYIPVAPTVPPGSPKVPTVQVVPIPTWGLGSAFSYWGATVYTPISPAIPPGLGKIPVAQLQISPFPPIERQVYISSGGVIVPNVLPAHPAYGIQTSTSPDLLPPKGVAIISTGRFLRSPTYIASFFVQGLAVYPPPPTFPEVGSAQHLYVSKPFQPFNLCAPEIYVYQVEPLPFPPAGSGYTSKPTILTPLPNRPSVHPQQPVLPPPSIFPHPGSAYSYSSISRNPFVLAFSRFPTYQEVPPQPIYPPQGVFFFRSGVVIVPFVQPPLGVVAKETVPPPGAVWPPPGFVLSYVSARPPFDTSGVEPITMKDVYTTGQSVTGSISN